MYRLSWRPALRRLIDKIERMNRVVGKPLVATPSTSFHLPFSFGYLCGTVDQHIQYGCSKQEKNQDNQNSGNHAERFLVFFFNQAQKL
jgi:hypothetical protein